MRRLPSRDRAGPEGPRVVSLHDVTTEIVVALGAADVWSASASRSICREGARSGRRRPARRRAPSRSFRVRPDVVLGLGVVAERDPELVNRLRAAGSRRLSRGSRDARRRLVLTRSIAARVRAVAAGEKIVASACERAATRASRPPLAPLRVFVYDCCDPPFTAGKKTVLTDLIARAGGHNVFADLEADWTHVSWEEAVARRPELVVIHAYQHDGQGDVADKRKALAAIPSLAGCPRR